MRRQSVSSRVGAVHPAAVNSGTASGVSELVAFSTYPLHMHSQKVVARSPHNFLRKPAMGRDRKDRR